MSHFIKQADGSMRYVGPYYDEATNPSNGWDVPDQIEEMDSMRVNVFDVNACGEETLRCVCDLADCFPDDMGDEYEQARVELRDAGRFWIGGGAAPLVLLIRVTD